jgi:hypothetical protein
MLRLWLAATTVVAMMTGVAVAQTSSSIGPAGPQPPGGGEPIMTSTGSAVPTGYLGSMALTTTQGPGNQSLPTDYTVYSGSMADTAIPGSGSQGMDDGNATRMIVPGHPPEAASTPE